MNEKTNEDSSQKSSMPKIQLVPQSIDETADWAVWRTDYYICTGIAYARTLGKTGDDFAVFVGNLHTWEDLKGRGLEPAVQLLYFYIKTYKDGAFEILSETEHAVTMRFNRPYSKFFAAGPMLGVSLDEFEAFFWQHITILASRIGLDFKHHLENDLITATLSMKSY